MSAEASPQDPIISLVVAMGENRAIGLGGDLPWRLRSDMKFFRTVTMGKPVLMGRRTFLSLPRVLDGRLNIVLTRDEGFEAPAPVVVAPNLDKGLDAAREWCTQTGAPEIMIIGGEGVFAEALPQAGRIYLTEVHASPRADTWFPDFDSAAWHEVYRGAQKAGARDDHDFSIVVLERGAASSSSP